MSKSSASFSRCKKYRYTLTRTWDTKLPKVMFVGLNPSTADAEVDDPTVRRCVRFARDWGFGGLVLTNLFAFRSTDPKRLKAVADPVGPENDLAIGKACKSVDCVVVAWGVHGTLSNRDRVVLAMLESPNCLGVTSSGAPRHPLYLAACTPRRRFRTSSHAVAAERANDAVLLKAQRRAA